MTETANSVPLKAIGENVSSALQQYFGHATEIKPKNVYSLVMGEIELPLLRTTLEFAKGNQKLAAELLGINRATLRKKLLAHQLIPNS